MTKLQKLSIQKDSSISNADTAGPTHKVIDFTFNSYRFIPGFLRVDVFTNEIEIATILVPEKDWVKSEKRKVSWMNLLNGTSTRPKKRTRPKVLHLKNQCHER
ncbi:MAG: hypothetical protein ACTHML_08700 [Ginsengibacter sp.]